VSQHVLCEVGAEFFILFRLNPYLKWLNQGHKYCGVLKERAGVEFEFGR
jgi:hypothetical protein